MDATGEYYMNRSAAAELDFSSISWKYAL